MNEVIRALKERRSIRSYRTEQVREEDLQQILEAATYAPSGMGAQPVILVAVQDPATIARLSQLNAAVMGTKTDPFYGPPRWWWYWPTKAAPPGWRTAAWPWAI